MILLFLEDIIVALAACPPPASTPQESAVIAELRSMERQMM